MDYAINFAISGLIITVIVYIFLFSSVNDVIKKYRKVEDKFIRKSPILAKTPYDSKIIRKYKQSNFPVSYISMFIMLFLFIVFFIPYSTGILASIVIFFYSGDLFDFYYGLADHHYFLYCSVAGSVFWYLLLMNWIRRFNNIEDVLNTYEDKKFPDPNSENQHLSQNPEV